MVYRYNNAAYARWLKCPLAQITAVYAQVLPHLERALAGDRSHFEITAEHDHSSKFLRGSYVPKLDEHGTIVGVFGLIQDQTALKLAEDQLRRMADSTPSPALPIVPACTT